MNVRIGIESELPTVDAQGMAADERSVQALFGRLARQEGFSTYSDATSGTVVGVRSRRGSGTLDVGNDYGFCTVEMALPPEEGFAAAKSAWHHTLDSLLLPALGAEALSVLAHGCQPRTETLGRAYLADKGHYQFWLAQAERFPGHYASDAWPGFAAVQFNIDVPLSDVIPVCNTLISMTPLLCAWGANSAVFGERVQPWQSLRMRGYQELAESNPFFADRLLFPRRLYSGLAQYMQDAWATPVFEVTRAGMIYRPMAVELTTAEFAAAGEAEFVDFHGAKRTLQCTVGDLASGLVFYWPAVRVRMRLDETCSVAEVLAAVAAGRPESVLHNGGRDTFVEVRHLPTMSRPETFSWLAMILGWLDNIEQCEKLFRPWTLALSRAAMPQVQAHGWDAEAAGAPIGQWAQQAFAVAEEGLRRGKAAPAEELEPLARRLRDRTNPATDAVACLRAEGIEALVEKLRM
ncbi:glutamate-cysteine ligase family protein [Streptomyces sp. NBC_01197]|uniref:glutamate-cysteine ligase family protein n=1 Tax=Streptomyces sp. NBC_01197 TaxID=2903768 RepID=UPI002E0F0900|nr:glutamate-cysteine ligase family protein [Streptomyces sp. NBC_01197]